MHRMTLAAWIMCCLATACSGAPIVPEKPTGLAKDFEFLRENSQAGYERAAEELARKYGKAAIPFLKEKGAHDGLALLTLVKLECPESLDVLSELLENKVGLTLDAITYLPAPLARTLVEQAARKANREELFGEGLAKAYARILAIVGDRNSLSVMKALQDKAKAIDPKAIDPKPFHMGVGDLAVQNSIHDIQNSIHVLQHRLSLNPAQEREWTEQELNFWRADRCCPFKCWGVDIGESVSYQRKDGIRYSTEFLRSKIHISDPTSARPSRSFLDSCPSDLLALAIGSGRKELLPDMKKYAADNTLKGDFARSAMAAVGTDEVLRILERAIEPIEKKKDVNADIVRKLTWKGDEKSVAFLGRLAEDPNYSLADRASFQSARDDLKKRLLEDSKDSKLPEGMK